jgi:hypothetical protein
MTGDPNEDTPSEGDYLAGHLDQHQLPSLDVSPVEGIFLSTVVLVSAAFRLGQGGRG